MKNVEIDYHFVQECVL
jgi:hypothetical protein